LLMVCALAVVQAGAVWWMGSRPGLVTAVVLCAGAGIELLYPEVGPGVALIVVCTFAWLRPARVSSWGLAGVVALSTTVSLLTARWGEAVLWFVAALLSWSWGAAGGAEGRRQATDRGGRVAVPAAAQRPRPATWRARHDEGRRRTLWAGHVGFGDLQRLSGPVEPAGARTGADPAVRTRPRAAEPRCLHPVQRASLDERRLRRRELLPPLAGPARRRTTDRPATAPPTGPRPVRRTRRQHPDHGGPRGRAAIRAPE
jgi:hypothetical protein